MARASEEEENANSATIDLQPSKGNDSPS